MKIIWMNNDNERIFDTLKTKKLLSKLKKAVKKHINDPAIIDRVNRSKNVADVHWSIYSLIGNSEFQEFKITS